MCRLFRHLQRETHSLRDTRTAHHTISCHSDAFGTELVATGHTGHVFGRVVADFTDGLQVNLQWLRPSFGCEGGQFFGWRETALTERAAVTTRQNGGFHAMTGLALCDWMPL